MEGTIVDQDLHTISETSICHYSRNKGTAITIRGYNLIDIANNCSLEEAIYLLYYGRLPDESELEKLKENIISRRIMSESLQSYLENLPDNLFYLQLVSLIVHYLDLYENKKNNEEVLFQINALTIPSIIYYYHYKKNKIRLNINTGNDAMAVNMIKLLHYNDESKYSNASYIRLIEKSLVTTYEIGMPHSITTSRIASSGGNSIYECLKVGSICFLGIKHFGAIRMHSEKFKDIKSVENVKPLFEKLINNKETIYGFGHPVLKNGDPRCDLIMNFIKEGNQYQKLNNEEEILIEKKKVIWEIKKLVANIDLHIYTFYKSLNIDELLGMAFVASMRLNSVLVHSIEHDKLNKVVLGFMPLVYKGEFNLSFTPLKDRKTSKF